VDGLLFEGAGAGGAGAANHVGALCSLAEYWVFAAGKEFSCSALPWVQRPDADPASSVWSQLMAVGRSTGGSGVSASRARTRRFHETSLP
jgi:hypothetical protein